MPESAGPGDSVTRTVLPECSPTPSRLTAFRRVCCLMTGPRGSNRGATPSMDPNCGIHRARLLAAGEAWCGPVPTDDPPPGALGSTFRRLAVDDDLDPMAPVAARARTA